MAHAENSIIINKPPQEVYNFLADGLNNPKWRDAVISISLKSGQAGQLGAEYAQSLRGPAVRAIAGDYKLTAAEPFSRLAFTVTAGPARPEGEYRLESTGNSTTIIFTLDLQTKGLMRLMDPIVTKTMHGEVSNLNKLKEVLEASA